MSASTRNSCAGEQDGPCGVESGRHSVSHRRRLHHLLPDFSLGFQNDGSAPRPGLDPRFVSGCTTIPRQEEWAESSDQRRKEAQRARHVNRLGLGAIHLELVGACAEDEDASGAARGG